MPARQPMRGRLWLNDGSCVRLRTQRTNDVWAYDFVQVRTRDGRGVRLLTVINEYTRECLAIRAQRSIRSSEVIETLVELMLTKEVPAHIRSDNGPEFTAGAALLIVLFAVTATACDSGELEVNAPTLPRPDLPQVISTGSQEPSPAGVRTKPQPRDSPNGNPRENPHRE